jgi:hypothetical protein
MRLFVSIAIGMGVAAGTIAIFNRFAATRRFLGTGGSA